MLLQILLALETEQSTDKEYLILGKEDGPKIRFAIESIYGYVAEVKVCTYTLGDSKIIGIQFDKRN